MLFPKSAAAFIHKTHTPRTRFSQGPLLELMGLGGPLPDKILVVDDDPFICSALSGALKRWGYEVATETDPLVALDRVQVCPPSLVLLDVVMPQMFGPEFLQEAKAIKPSLPVIMVTGVQDEAAASLAKKMGALDYLYKPIDMDQLQRSVKSALDDRPGPKAG